MDRRLVNAVFFPVVFLACMSISQAQVQVLETPPADLQDQDISGSCTCMPYHKCKQNTNQTFKVSGYLDHVINIREVGSSTECEHYLDRCCFPADQTTSPVEVHPTSGVMCGLRHPDGVGFRITDGKDHESNYGEFPWMVAVLRRVRVIADVTLKTMECGGSIIHPRVVLTGAHCVKNYSSEMKKDLLIRAGEWDTQTEKELYPTQERDVEQVIIHEHYYARGLHNDVALLVLDKPLQLNPVVGTLCLPGQGENMDGRTCVVSGWGKDVFGKKGKYSVILKRVELPVVPRGLCLEALRTTRLGPRFRLHESYICAGGQTGIYTCKGDGGGPLACLSKDDPSVYVQAGIVAWGIGCGTTTPTVYVNVSHFRKWIDDKIASLQLS